MFELFLAELRRTWIQFRRYPVEAIAEIFVYSAVFYGLFLSARYIAGPTFQLGNRLDSIVIGYVLWNLMLFIITDIAGNLQYEAQTGTLEQLFLSRFGAIKVFLMRTLASLMLRMVFIISILCIIMALTGSRLNFPPSLLLPFVTVLMAGYGIAFAMGSLALLFKRAERLLVMFQFLLLFSLTTPTETWKGSLQILANLLPLTPGAGLLRDLMARGESLNFTKLVIAFVNGGIYFAVGLLLFRIAERVAKRRGILSGY
ncbi:ABC transporter [Fischerella sp. PCC 9605]|uniref:ABC transporter n=1 Tax=Fischerella sp. PCC 9605 TaxID=1173024 RepID=UPI00047DD9D3|nr:ABC transporter [Fischerella sp. PCC 9605]